MVGWPDDVRFEPAPPMTEQEIAANRQAIVWGAPGRTGPPLRDSCETRPQHVDFPPLAEANDYVCEGNEKCKCVVHRLWQAQLDGEGCVLDKHDVEHCASSCMSTKRATA